MISEDALLQHIVDIKSGIGNIDTRLGGLERAVTGNGQPGLVQKVESLDGSRKWFAGAGAAITFLLGVAEWLIHRHSH